MVEVQLTHLHCAVVGRQVVEARGGNVGADGAAALAQRQVGIIVSPVGLQLAGEGHRRQAQAVDVGQVGDEAQVVALGLQGYLSLEAADVGHVVGHAVGMGMQRRGQRHVNAGELQPLHVSVERPFDGQRLVRVVAHELLRQVAHEAHQVLLAQHGIEAHPHLARVQRVSHAEVNIRLTVHAAIRCAQCQPRQFDVRKSRVEAHAAGELCHL